MTIGTVTWFNAVRGFGFIRPEDGGPEVCVHRAAIELSGLALPSEGQRLRYERIELRSGRYVAENVFAIG